MNAAFLLLTGVALAGPSGHGGAAPAPAGSCCSGSCGAATSCCDSCDSGCKPGLFDRLRARFAKNDCCDSCTTCAPVHYHAAPTCNTCDSGCGKASLFDRFRKSSCDSGCGASCGATCGASCNTCDDCGKPGLFARLRGRFSKGDCCESSCNSGCANGAAVGGVPAPVALPAAPAGEHIEAAPATEAPKVMPKGDKKVDPKKEAPKKAAPKKEEKKTGQFRTIPSPAAEITPAASNEEGTTNPFELDRRYESRVARAADYSSLTGQLFYVHADGGLWVLRYAPLSQEDDNGGGVILARGLPMSSYREGDLVSVKGEVLRAKGSKFLGAPLYRASTIQLVDRAGN